MLSNDMSRNDDEGSQDRNLQPFLPGSTRKRAILTVDGMQEADGVEVKPEVKKSKKFRIEWMEEVNFRDWLKPHPSDDTYCICAACDIKLRCGKSELEKHASGLKHTRRIEAMKFSLNRKEKSSQEETPKDEAQPETSIPQTHIYYDESGSSYIVACEEHPEKTLKNSDENTFTLSESTLSGVLLKIVELVEGKMNFTNKRLEMAEMEHECKMQILQKELQLKSLEVQIKEAELQKLRSAGLKIVGNHIKHT